MRAHESRELQGRLYETLVTPVTNGWRAATHRLHRRRQARGVQTRALAPRRRRRGARAPGSAACSGWPGSIVAIVPATDGGPGCDRRPRPVRLQRRSLQERRARSAPVAIEALIVAASLDANPSELEAAIERGRILGESTNLARELATSRRTCSRRRSSPSGPPRFAVRAGIAVDVLDEAGDRARSAWACCSASRAAAPSRRA